MAVLPESMDRLDVNDAPGSFAKIQDYIRYMGERIEFSMRNMTKTVSAAGVSSAEIYILYQAQSQQLAALTTYGRCLGLAFQIRDDMLDVIGTAEEMGKGVGTDANKNTFVRLYGLEKCEELVNRYTAAALDSLTVFEDHTYMAELAKSLTTRRV